MSVQLFCLVNVEFARVFDAAARAVVQAVVPIDLGVGGREQLLRPLRLGEFVTVLRRWHFGR